MNFAERYADYLKSEEWARRRDKVMQRAGRLCEGCRDCPAVDVHHLSYENVTREFLFELVALCGDCHDRVHGHPTRPRVPTWTPRHKSQERPAVIETPGARARRDRLAGLAAQHRLKPMPGEETGTTAPEHRDIPEASHG